MNRHWVSLLALCTPLCWAGSFSVHSSSVQHGAFDHAQFAASWGCTGQDVSPQISWSGAPANSKSFAVTIYDLDAPTGSGWWHWVVVNIPAGTASLPAGASGHPQLLPPGALETNTDGGVRRYNGLCPPPGQTHRYRMTVHALKVERLALDPQATGAMAGFMINMNSLAQASLTVKAARE